MKLLFSFFISILGLRSHALECTNFSGIYLNDDRSNIERCIEIKQTNCESYEYSWFTENSKVTMNVITDGIFRKYPQQPSTFKSFNHLNDSGKSFKFYKEEFPENINEVLSYKLANNNIKSVFISHYKDGTRDVFYSTLHLMKSKKQCLDSLASETH